MVLPVLIFRNRRALREGAGEPRRRNRAATRETEQQPRLNHDQRTEPLWRNIADPSHG